MLQFGAPLHHLFQTLWHRKLKETLDSRTRLLGLMKSAFLKLLLDLEIRHTYQNIERELI